MSQCNHWDDDCMCDVGFLGSIILVIGTLWIDRKKKQAQPTSPPKPPTQHQFNN